MKWSKDFQDFLAELSDDEYVGLGNPDAKILFVGKEAANDVGSKLNHGTKRNYLEGKDYSESFVPNPNDPEQDFLRDGRCTWQKYQKLYEKINQRLQLKEIRKIDKYEITFVKNVFTTELSCLSAPNTVLAKKQGSFVERLERRKKDFWSKDFIKCNFPIVLIFADDNKYIETYKGEVCKLFNIDFDREYLIGDKNKMWVHYSKEKSHLLIHTRQLAGASLELIDKIANIVSEFVKENNIEIRVK